MMKVENTLNGNEGKGFVTIDGKTRELFELLKLEANIELIVSERKVLGNRMVQHKVVGAKGTGSITMYFNNAELLKTVQTYLQKVKCQRFLYKHTTKIQQVMLEDKKWY